MGLLLYSQNGNNMPVKTHDIFVFFGSYTHSGLTSFFHSFAISIIDFEHIRKRMITSSVFFWSFLGTFPFRSLFQMPFVLNLAK